MVPLFERNPTELPLIFKLNLIYQRRHHRLKSWNLFFVTPPYLQLYADAVATKGKPLKNFFGFVHGTTAFICKRKGGVWPPRKGTWYKISECSFAKWLSYQP